MIALLVKYAGFLAGLSGAAGALVIFWPEFARLKYDKWGHTLDKTRRDAGSDPANQRGLDEIADGLERDGKPTYPEKRRQVLLGGILLIIAFAFAVISFWSIGA